MVGECRSLVPFRPHRLRSFSMESYQSDMDVGPATPIALAVSVQRQKKTISAFKGMDDGTGDSEPPLCQNLVDQGTRDVVTLIDFFHGTPRSTSTKRKRQFKPQFWTSFRVRLDERLSLHLYWRSFFKGDIHWPSTSSNICRRQVSTVNVRPFPSPSPSLMAKLVEASDNEKREATKTKPVHDTLTVIEYEWLVHVPFREIVRAQFIRNQHFFLEK